MHMNSIKAIYARSKDFCIGRENTLPWNFKKDLQYFKKTTLGSKVVMGYYTYTSINNPLVGRENYVLTSSHPKFIREGFKPIGSPREVLELEGDVFLIGGATLIETMMPFIDTIYETVIDTFVIGDTFIEPIDDTAFELVQTTQDVENGVRLNFNVWKRRA